MKRVKCSQVTIFRRYRVLVPVMAFIASVLVLTSCGWNKATRKITYVSPSLDSTTATNPKQAIIDWKRFKWMAKSGLLAGRYYFNDGIYDLGKQVTIASSGSPIVLIGSQKAVFKGRYKNDNNLNQGGGFTLASSDVEFDHLVFRSTATCIKAATNAFVNNIVIRQLDAKDTHSCILIDRNSNVTATNWLIENISIKRYFRVGIRLSGRNVYDIKINQFLIDASDSAASHCFKGGIQLLKQVNNISIDNGTITNIIGDCGQRYQQGDGIEADDKQGAPYNLSINNVVVDNSGDANFDIKAMNVVMNKVLSLSSGKTQSGFKLWNYNEYRCHACRIEGQYGKMVRLISAKAFFDWDNPAVTKRDNYLLLQTAKNRDASIMLDNKKNYTEKK